MKWEYLHKSVWRELKRGIFSGWSEWHDPVDLQQLGEAGWELVSVYTISSIEGESHAGATDSITYIFKRPKEQQ